jgi:hypothetical protein
MAGAAILFLYFLPSPLDDTDSPCYTAIDTLHFELESICKGECHETSVYYNLIRIFESFYLPHALG